MVVTVFSRLDVELTLCFYIFNLAVLVIVDRVQREETDWLLELALIAESKLKKALS